MKNQESAHGISMSSILIIPQKRFPCNHAMLETIYTRILPDMGYRVVWLMLSSEVDQITKENWNGTQVYAFPAQRRRGIQAYIAKQIGWIRILFFGAWLISRQRFDLIQVRNHVLAGWLCWFFSRLSHSQFVYQFSYPIPEELIKAAHEGRTRIPQVQIWQGKVEIKLRTLLLHRADLVLAISDQMRKEILELGVKPDRVMSFPLGTECPMKPDKSQIAKLRADLGLDEDNPVVLYFGTIKVERQLDFLVRVATIVNAECRDVHWLFVGSGPAVETKRLRRLFSESGLMDKVTFTGWVDRGQIPLYLTMADLSVSPIPTTSIFWVSSPTKAVESLASGCPVVGTNIPDQEFLISASGGGIVVPYEERAFSEAVLEMVKAPVEAQEMGERGKAFVRKHRSYEHLAEQLSQRYQGL